ncbi:PepSY-associated TM helix domain-containing protein [Shewanella maritima]|uniref:PepSY-associated TM helix domain-containing protein n=1 Tax=Shewanella maritima TaxID=2520507 RepID=UPI0037358996
MKVVPALKWFHNWVGFAISLTMLIVLSTGVYLGAMDILKRIDDKGQQYAPLTIEQKADITQTLFEKHPEMGTVRFPTEHSPFIEVAKRGESIAYDTDLNQLSTYKMSEVPMYGTIFWLHRNFLLGDVGKYVNAWASLVGGLITLVGIYLWWRVRKGFRLKQSIPTNTRSSSLLKSHIQLGLFISIPLFVLCITGFLITYKGLWTGALKQPTNLEQVQYPVSQAQDWHSQLKTAQLIWPDSQLVGVSKARQRQAQGEATAPQKKQDLQYSVRFDEHSDVWLRNADSIGFNYHTGQITSVVKHSERPLSGQVASFVRPLHDALNMPLKYVIFITLIAVVGTAILVFSTVTFYRRIFSKPKKSNVSPKAAAQAS